MTTGQGKETEKGNTSPEDAAKARLSRRGARLAFSQLSAKFGPRLLDVVPKMWQSMAGGLLSACATGMIVCFPRIMPANTIILRFNE